MNDARLRRLEEAAGRLAAGPPPPVTRYVMGEAQTEPAADLAERVGSGSGPVTVIVVHPPAGFAGEGWLGGCRSSD
jgi:hypothetical protein